MRREVLSDDFFVNLLDMRTRSEMSFESTLTFYGRDCTTNELK
jgi:catalase (peroxidase I)